VKKKRHGTQDTKRVQQSPLADHQNNVGSLGDDVELGGEELNFDLLGVGGFGDLVVEGTQAAGANTGGGFEPFAEDTLDFLGGRTARDKDLLVSQDANAVDLDVVTIGGDFANSVP